LDKQLQKAQHIFAQLPLPTRATHAWRFGVQPQEVVLQPTDKQPFFKKLSNGIIACDLHTFAQQFPEKMHHVLHNNFWQKEKYAALVEGFWQRSLVVLVPASVQSEEPIVLQELLQDHMGDQLIEKISVIVEPAASVIVHDLLSYQHQQVFRAIDYIVQDSAQCAVVYHQNVSRSTLLFEYATVFAQANAHISFECVISGAQQSKWWPSFYLVAQGSRIDVSGAYVLGGNQQCDIISLQHHEAQNAVSHVSINGVVADHAHAVYQGIVHIAKNASGTEACQQNKNILLHETAKVHSVPSLEALNNDVQCGHGSAIGHFDQEQLFYLMARGLPEPGAKKLVLESFLLGGISVAKLRSVILQLVTDLA
jgi:Fe-S cluster assembly protein SufD